MLHGQNELTEEYVQLTNNRNYRPWYQLGRSLFKEKPMILNLVATKFGLNISVQGEKFHRFQRFQFWSLFKYFFINISSA